MPKCSLVGVYNRARVEGAVKSADRCVVVKLRRKSMSGFVGVQEKDGMEIRDVDGAIMLYVSEFALALSTREIKVVTLSCRRGS